MKEKIFKIKKGTSLDLVCGGDGLFLDLGDFLIGNLFDENEEYVKRDFEVIVKFASGKECKGEKE